MFKVIARIVYLNISHCFGPVVICIMLQRCEVCLSLKHKCLPQSTPRFCPSVLNCKLCSHEFFFFFLNNFLVLSF